MAKGEGKKEDLPQAELLRRRLRIALTEARSDASRTQRATAQALDWSTSKIVRIEQGTVPVRPTDVRAMLSYYGVTDEKRVDELVELARSARDAKSWSDYDEVLSQTLKEMIGQEGAATSIWKHEPSFVPGNFQTATYAQILLGALGETSERVTMMSEVRDKRRSILSGGPEINVVIGEAALVRPVGGPKVMREQINELIEANRSEKLNLHLLPFAAGPHLALGQAFTVMQFNDPGLYDSLFLEDGEEKVRGIDDPELVLDHLNMYNHLQIMAESTGSFEDHADRILEQLYSD